jgi:transmembrane sensor
MDRNYWDLAAKVLEGKASPAEQQALQEWLKEDPAHREVYQQQKRLWQLTAPLPPQHVNVEAAFQKVSSQLALKSAKQKAGRQLSLSRYGWQIAASVALLVGLVWLLRLYTSPEWGMQQVVADRERVEVQLPDGSIAWINKGSRLRYEPDFQPEKRQLYLEGEAFFQVQKDPGRPFIVLTAHSRTSVLGTSFNLRAYKHEPHTELAVASGKVAFIGKSGETEAVLTAGQTAMLDIQKGNIQTAILTDENAWAWQTGVLQFEGRPLREMLPSIERYYGIQLQLKNEQIGSCRFTGRFINAPLEEVLQVLQTGLQLEISQQTPDHYVLSGKGCNQI